MTPTKPINVVEALQDIARQKTTDELSEQGDYEFAYDTIVKVARAALPIAERQEEVRATMLEALWVMTEHNALHFGKSHNTVIQGWAAIKAAKEPNP